MRFRTKVVLTEEALAEVVSAYENFEAFAFDVETRSHRPSRDPKGRKGQQKDIPALDTMTNEVFWISLAGPGRGDVIPCGHTFDGSPKQLTKTQVFQALRPLFFSGKVKIGHNIKFDLQSVAKYYGDEVPPAPYCDTQTMVHLIDETYGNKGGFNLKNLASKIIGYEYREKIGDLVDKVEFERVARYSLVDAKMAWLIYWKVWPIYQQPKKAKLKHLLLEVEMPVTKALIGMNRHGAYVNREKFASLSKDFTLRKAQAEETVYQLAGKNFNLNSPKQRNEFFYGELGIKCDFFTDKGAQSTNAKALLKLAKRNPVAKALQEYSDLHKMLTTYIDGYIPQIEDDNRIRASFNQSVPVTGRFSCSKPNLQNIPARYKQNFESKIIRELFEAPPGKLLIVGDFSQIELRILAHQTQDPTLLKAYREGLDLHRLTASKAYKVPEADVTKEQRAVGKTSNFNLAFEGGPARIVDAVEKEGGKMSVAESRRVYEAWHKTYPEVKRWGQRVKDRCWNVGYVETLYGRRRHLPEIRSHVESLQHYAERQAVNHPIQGSAADIAKACMVDLDNALADYPAQLVLQVHDEYVVEVDEELVDEVLQIVIEVMEGIKLHGEPVLSVPLVADVHAGKTWAEAK
jgi:DNA polymerase-1